MRLLLVAIGSTGDVQPMIVLGEELKRRGHEVTVMAFSALAPLIEKAGLHIAPIPGDASEYISAIIQPGARPWTYLSRLESFIRGMVAPAFDILYQICQSMDAVVTTFFGTTVYAVADHLGIPLFQSNYCLTDMTGDHCLPVMRQPPWGRGLNRATYRIAYRMIGAVEKRYVWPLYERHGISPRSMARGPSYQVAGRPVPVFYAISEHVVPRPPEWPDNIRFTGFWEREERDHTPSNVLADFLADDPAPVYIGFGSMNTGDMEQALGTIVNALRQSNLRAVLSAGWGGLDGAALPDTVHVLREYVPHDWLFRQVCAVAHHGGAGTTAAGLIAGKPSLIIPFGSDQFFWGERVRQLGCGPRPLPRTRLRGDTLAASLLELTQTRHYAEHAEQLRALLLQEHGPQTTADFIEQTMKSDTFSPARPNVY